MVDRPKNKPKGDYEVGWAKTPEHTRFKKGGPNPSRGRKKGAVNRSPLRRVLETKIPLLLDGKRKRLPLGEAIAFLSARDAVTGSAADRKLMLHILVQLERLMPAGPEPPSPEDQARKHQAATRLSQMMVDYMSLYGSLLHYGLLIKEDGKLAIPASVMREAAVHRQRRYRQSYSGATAAPGVDEATGEPDVKLDPDNDISLEERRQLLDEVTPEPWTEMMARAAAQQPKRKARKAAQAPQGEAGEEASPEQLSSSAEGAAPSEAEDQPGDAEEDLQGAEAGPVVEPAPSEPPPRPTAHDLLSEILNLKKKD